MGSRLQNLKFRTLLSKIIIPLVAICEQLPDNFWLITLLASRTATVWIDIGLHGNLMSNLVHRVSSNGFRETDVKINEWARDWQCLWIWAEATDSLLSCTSLQFQQNMWALLNALYTAHFEPKMNVRIPNSQLLISKWWEWVSDFYLELENVTEQR